VRKYWPFFLDSADKDASLASKKSAGRAAPYQLARYA
jgi:hypothetical protein